MQLRLSIDEIRGSTKELINSEYVYVKKVNDIIYFILPDHFNKVPKADSTVLKVKRAIDELPKDIQKLLDKLNINTTKKVVTFVEPTPLEVEEYAISKGHMIDGDKFVSYYKSLGEMHSEDGAWYDTRGKQVRDWRGKARRVWFKSENKMSPCSGAPKGYEFFNIMFEGSIAFPEYWKDGKPHSKNFILNKRLQKEYEERKKDS